HIGRRVRRPPIFGEAHELDEVLQPEAGHLFLQIGLDRLVPAERRPDESQPAVTALGDERGECIDRYLLALSRVETADDGERRGVVWPALPHGSRWREVEAVVDDPHAATQQWKRARERCGSMRAVGEQPSSE